MQEAGLDLNNHESQPLTQRMVQHADLILTMTQGHLSAIVGQWPESADRVQMLSQTNLDVSDPIGGPIEVYRSCAKQIDGFLDNWIDKIDPKIFEE